MRKQFPEEWDVVRSVLRCSVNISDTDDVRVRGQAMQTTETTNMSLLSLRLQYVCFGHVEACRHGKKGSGFCIMSVHLFCYYVSLYAFLVMLCKRMHACVWLIHAYKGILVKCSKLSQDLFIITFIRHWNVHVFLFVAFSVQEIWYTFLSLLTKYKTHVYSN